LKKKHKKRKKKEKKRRRQFWGKKAKKKKKKKEKKHVWKVKTKFSTSSILKKTFEKDNFERKTRGETL
jgi:hypothetical protein